MTTPITKVVGLLRASSRELARIIGAKPNISRPEQPQLAVVLPDWQVWYWQVDPEAFER